MQLNRTASLRLIKIGIAIVLAGLIITYAIFRSLPYTKGPHIGIFQPLEGSSIPASTVTIVGRADRVNKLQLNGSPVSMDEQGNFSETVTLFSGTNVLTLDASDQFGRATHTTIHLFGTVDFPIRDSTATTSATSSVTTAKTATSSSATTNPHTIH